MELSFTDTEASTLFQTIAGIGQTNPAIVALSAKVDALSLKLDAILAAQAQTSTNLLALQTETHTDMAALDDQITSLTGEVTRNTSVESSALALINGFAAQLAAAVQAAEAAGATPAQLASLGSLQATLAANDTALAAAVAANTTAPPTTGSTGP